RREGVELSDRRGQSRFGSFLLSERAPVHRHADGLAAIDHRHADRRRVSRSDLATRVNFDRVRTARGFEVRSGVKRYCFLLLLPALACAQGLQETIAQGEKVFNQSCATGYCHGTKGAAGGGAPPRVSGIA